MRPLELIQLSQALEDCQKRLAGSEERVRVAREALEKIAKPTYGTELCNSSEENDPILASHMLSHQKIARSALAAMDGGEK